jgi:hypothetical protein
MARAKKADATPDAPATPPKAKKPRAKKPDAIPAQPAIEIAPAQAPKHGRKSVYTDELGQMICERLAQGRTLTSVCKDADIPATAQAVRVWAMDPEHPISLQYARAREVGYQAMADETVDIGDQVFEDPGSVAKARLRVDTRKWLLSKALPKIYGDKVALTDADGGKFVIEFAV